MEAATSSETSVSYITTRSHKPEDLDLKSGTVHLMKGIFILVITQPHRTNRLLKKYT